MANSAVGLFQAPEAAVAAAGELKGAGFDTDGLDVMSPIPLHGIEEVLGRKEPVIKRFTFFGGIFGATFGFVLAAGTSVLYLHPVGGRPIITIPPFLIITYEMTIMFGILATVIGFLLTSRLPAIRDRVYVPESAVDRFVVSVACDSEGNFLRAEAILREAGADEVCSMAEDT